ncbi:hypothetical protein NDU88_001855 [Pleurodeles waltl]|uniref:Uncharacterized protein n=1 Tax=Pleurodeles waltl TaxID=8319 RepID=A0AAV7U866_PLEWA|nr:hypothetical protein NDU88_001855 [Pleurodeles waltl]
MPALLRGKPHSVCLAAYVLSSGEQGFAGTRLPRSSGARAPGTPGGPAWWCCFPHPGPPAVLHHGVHPGAGAVCGRRTPSAQAARWKMWVERLETYFAALALDPDRRRPMLIHLGGAAIHKIIKAAVEECPLYSYQSLKWALPAYFEPLAIPDHERFLLRQAR